MHINLGIQTEKVFISHRYCPREFIQILCKRWERQRGVRPPDLPPSWIQCFLQVYPDPKFMPHPNSDIFVLGNSVSPWRNSSHKQLKREKGLFWCRALERSVQGHLVPHACDGGNKRQIVESCSLHGREEVKGVQGQRSSKNPPPVSSFLHQHLAY